MPLRSWELNSFKVPKKCPNRVSSHFPLFRHTLQSSNIPILHMLHGTGWCILFQYFETKKLMFLTARQNYSLLTQFSPVKNFLHRFQLSLLLKRSSHYVCFLLSVEVWKGILDCLMKMGMRGLVCYWWSLVEVKIYEEISKIKQKGSFSAQSLCWFLEWIVVK
jgi:hypothetical protein